MVDISPEHATDIQGLLEPLCVQVTPESFEVYMNPVLTTATKFVPSNDEATALQFRITVLLVQLRPESIDVQIWPPVATVTNLVPSDEDATSELFSNVDCLNVHVKPESVEV